MRERSVAGVVPAWLLAISFGLVSSATGGERKGEILTPLDGPAREVKLRAILPGGKVVVEDGKASSLAELRSIERPGAAVGTPAGGARLFLGVGGELCCREVRLEAGKWRVAWLSDLELPLGCVRAVLLGGGKAARELFERERATAEKSAEDRVVVLTSKGPRVLGCVVASLDRERLLVRYRGKQRRVGRDKVCGLVLAAAGRGGGSGGEEKSAVPCRVVFADGSRLLAGDLRLEDGKLRFRLRAAGKTPVCVPWERVVRVEPVCDRLVYLSDLRPAREQAGPLVTFKVSWQRDRTVLGRPLTLRGKVFAKGIGVHADSRLEYALGGKYRVFAAVAGIDAETGGRGDCIFRVWVDGRKAWEKRLRGNDAPRSVRLDVAGAERLVLEVDAGENLDLADHADWADARLLK